MAQKVMTQAELTDLIAKWANDNVATLVKTQIEQAVAPLAQRQTDWMERMLGGGHGHTRERELKPEDKGLDLARCLRATVCAKLRGGGPDAAIEILKQWGNRDLAEKWAEARTKALAAGDATAGGFLVPPQFSQDVIEFLRARAVVRGLGARAIPIPTGTVKVPKLTGGATATYIGENTNIVKSEQTFGQLTLTFKKLAVLTPMSNDLARYSSPGADALVRDDLVNAMRIREDSAFIRDTGSDSTPKGLRFWANADHLIAATATASVQNTFTDLGKLVQKLLEANMPMIAPAWIMAPRTQQYLMTLLNTNGIAVFRPEMSGGRLWGFPFGVTTSIPTNLDANLDGTANESEIYLVDMAQAIIGESMNLLVDASQEAAYHDGSAVQAAFSLDQTVVRAIAEHDFGMRHDKAIAVLTQVTWAPGSV